MYRPHSSKKTIKRRRFSLVITKHTNGAFEAGLETFDPDCATSEETIIGSPNGRTSEHGFFTALGLAIGEQFKKA
jgi:hypothetical protein